MFNIVIKDEGVTYRLKSTMCMLSRFPSKVVLVFKHLKTFVCSGLLVKNKNL